MNFLLMMYSYLLAQKADWPRALVFLCSRPTGPGWRELSAMSPPWSSSRLDAETLSIDSPSQPTSSGSGLAPPQSRLLHLERAHVLLLEAQPPHTALGDKLPSVAKNPRIPVGTTFSFTLNEQAHVSFAFIKQASGRTVKGHCVGPTKTNLNKPRCKRGVTAGSLSFMGHTGLNKLAFQGRISRSKKLTPGRYTLVIAATNATGGRSASHSLRFTIVKP
jgi:hypothetical protein